MLIVADLTSISLAGVRLSSVRSVKYLVFRTNRHMYTPLIAGALLVKFHLTRGLLLTILID